MAGRITYHTWHRPVLELVREFPGLSQFEYRKLLIQRSPYYSEEHLRKVIHYSLKWLVENGYLAISGHLIYHPTLKQPELIEDVQTQISNLTARIDALKSELSQLRSKRHKLRLSLANLRSQRRISALKN